MAPTTPAKVTFRVTTYWKRPRGQPGITQLASKRLTATQALDWLLAAVPDDAVTIAPGPGSLLVITIDALKFDG